VKRFLKEHCSEERRSDSTASISKPPFRTFKEVRSSSAAPAKERLKEEEEKAPARNSAQTAGEQARRIF